MMEEFSARTRAANLEAIAREPVDVLVIGAGIVGAWTALIASLRGFRTALVDKGDFASGTSSKTSRLIHGGLRYLQKFRIGIVAEAARGRDELLRIAPDLVRPLTFLIPVYRDRGPKGWQLRLGLWLYDALSRGGALPSRRWLSAGEAVREEPALARDGLLGAATYSDAMANDARVVLSVVRAAADAGALVANYAEVTELGREERLIRWARVSDGETGREIVVRTLAVINATGVWAPDLQPPNQRLPLRPTKGVHAFVPLARLGIRHAIVLPTSDRRTMFVIPWSELALIGTTDTDYVGDRERVDADASDVEYLLGTVNRHLPAARLGAADVVGTYAGLRPLVDTGERRESDISRRHELQWGPDGLLTVTGGKFTTGLAMALQAVEGVESVVYVRIYVEGIEAGRGRRHARREAARRLRALRPVRRDWIRIRDQPPPPLPRGVAAAVRHCAREEMAVRLEDVLVRRFRVFSETGDQGVELAPSVAHVLGEELGWTPERRAQELARFQDAASRSRRWRDGLG